MKFTIFISYTSKDRELAEYVKQRLKDLEALLPDCSVFKIWSMDSDCAGNWSNECRDNLTASNIVIALLSDNVSATSVVHREVDLAKTLCNKGALKLIPVILSDTQITDDISKYTNIFCEKGLTEEKLNEIYVKIKSYLEYLLLQPYLSDKIKRIGNKSCSQYFVGREREIDDIKKYFDNNKKTVVLSGIGGIGKTELAKNFVLKYSSEYPNSYLIKLNASDNDAATARDVKELVANIRFEKTPNTTDIEELYAVNLQCLKNLDKRTLLIIDGYDVNLDTVSNLWEVFNNLSCEVIFTSRYSSNIIPSVTVNALSDKESIIALFKNHCNNIAENDVLNLAKNVNYHTLTLELIAKLLGTSKIITAERLKQSIFDVQSKVAREENSNATILDHLDKIFDLAKLSQFKKDILSLLCRVCSLGLTFEEINSVVKINEANEHELQELVDIGFVRYDGKYSLHAVISEVAFRKLNFNLSQKKSLLLLYGTKLTSVKPTELTTKYEMLDYCDYFVQKRSTQDEDRNYMIAESEFYYLFGVFLQDLYMLTYAAEIFEKALETRSTLCMENKEILPLLNALVNTYVRMEKFDKAMTYAQKALRTSIAVHGENNYNSSTEYNNIADILRGQNNYFTALKYYNKALSLSLMKAPDYKTACILDNMSGIYLQMGQYNHALYYAQQALKIFLNELGIDANTATCYENLGSIYATMGDHSNALNCFLSAKQIYEKLYRGAHALLGNCYYAIGFTLHNLNRLDESKQYITDALNILTACNNCENRIAMCYDTLGNIYADKNDYKSAIDYYKKAIEIYEATNSKMGVAGSMTNIANVFLQLGQIKETIAFYENALKLFRAVLGDNHIEVEKLKMQIEVLKGLNV